VFTPRPQSFNWRFNPLWRAATRIQLSLAKHPGLLGHPKMALRLSKLVPEYHYGADEAFEQDGAPTDIVARRRKAFQRLAATLRDRAPRTHAESAVLAPQISDLAFVNAHRVPFQFRAIAESQLPVGAIADATDGPRVRDLDGNWAYDLSGSYGVNLFGHDFYKACIDEGVAAARDLGMILGPYHPIIRENVERLCAISGMDEVSFHMSGTEAVMQATRLARYHTKRSHVVRFAGAYHGWSDGLQAGPGNPRPAREVYTLPEMSGKTLGVLRSHDNIAAVLVNPIQAMHPNGGPPTDASLVTGVRTGKFDKAAYSAWLRELRDVCTARGIVLIFDEVFLGFRLAIGGAQEYFGVGADLVTYGKTLGGGLPVGVVCGKAELMRRFKDGRATDLCFARGTFNSHPYVMTAMAAFLRRLETEEIHRTYVDIDTRWDPRAAALNGRLEAAGVPVRIHNMVSVWAAHFTQPGRYHWLLQYYLRAHGITMGWIGTGRFILSHDLTDADMAEIGDRFVAAAQAMHADGWFWYDEALGHQEFIKVTKRRVLRETLAALTRPARPVRDVPTPRASSGQSILPAGA
jgi:glutamate-1-semialdehyde 2,1-aminomutase